jgi:hypothetical protein
VIQPPDPSTRSELILKREKRTVRTEPGTNDRADAIREIGLEIATAVREVGAMLVNVGWEQSYARGVDCG